MSDFQSFRDAVLEDEDLQEQVISIVNTATANGAGLEENIVTLAKNHGYTVTEDDVTQHADFLGQDGDLTDFELEMISGGMRDKHEQRSRLLTHPFIPTSSLKFRKLLCWK